MAWTGRRGSVRRRRDVWLLVAGQGLSAAGDVLAAVALTIRVHDLTGSGLAVAALLVADLAAHVLVAPLAGMLVDRAETVRVLVVTALLQAGLAFVHSLPLLVALLFLVGAGATVTSPAVLAIVPTVVGSEATTPTNAWLELARYTGGAAAPAAAGVLTARFGTAAALLADGATFAALAAATAALSVRRPAQPAQGQPPATAGTAGQARQARQGVVLLWQEPVLRLTSVVVTVTVVFAVMDNVALVFFAKDTLHASDGGYGALLSVWTAGMVAGIVMVARRLPVRALALGVLLADTATGAAVLGAAWFGSFAVAVGLFVVAGAGNGIGNVARRSLLHQRTPQQLHGRVFAANAALLSSGQLLAVALGGVLVGAVGPRWTLLVAGAGTVAVGLAGLLGYLRLPADVRATRSGPHAPPSWPETMGGPLPGEPGPSPGPFDPEA